MGATIIGTGRGQLRQSLAISDRLANSERQRNHANKQIEQAEDAQQSQAIGSTVGVVAQEGIDAFGSTQAPAPIVDATPVGTSTEVANTAMNDSVQTGLQTAIDQQVGQQAGQQVAGQAIGEQVAGQAIGESAVAAGAETTAAAVGEAVATEALGTAAAEAAIVEGGAAVAGELTTAATTSASFGPVGWAVSAGLLAASLLG